MWKHFRFQEAALDDKGGGGGDAAANSGGGDWRASFGAEAAPALKDFKEPGDFFKSFQAANTELTTLKSKAPTFDWRKELGGEDDKANKFLQRFTDPKTFMKTALEAHGKISAGEFLKPLDKAATPEQVTAWRSANGVPEKSEAYLEKLPDGLVIGAEDLPAFTGVAKELHALNAKPEVMHTLAKWYYADQQKANEAVSLNDKKQASETNETLRAEWGGDFQANKARVSAHLDGLGKEMKEAVMNARMPDGRALFNSPDFVKWLDTQAREVNPASALLPIGVEGNMQSVDTEITKIETVMKKDRKTYDKDTKMQARLRDLYTVREQLKTKKV